MRRATLLVMACMAAGYGSGEAVPEGPVIERPGPQPPPVPNQVDKIPPWSFGVRFPDSPDSFTSHEAWEAWRRRTWPPACAAIEARTVKGLVEPATRQCQLIDIQGYVPVAYLQSRGMLRAETGETYDVVWEWTTIPRAGDRECDFDPVPDQRGPWKLQRNAPDRLWQMYMPGNQQLGDSERANAQCRMVLDRVAS